MPRMVAFRKGLEAVFVIADHSTGVAYPLSGKNVLNKECEILNIVGSAHVPENPERV